MEHLKTVVLLVAVLIFHVESHPTNSEESSTLEKLKEHITGIWHHNLDKEALHALSSLHPGSPTDLEQFLHSATNTIRKFQTCKSETKKELFKIAVMNLFNFQSCINATRDIADFEEFFLHIYTYFGQMDTVVIDLFKSVVDCHDQKNIFEIFKCVVSSVQDNGSSFNTLLSSLLNLLTEVENDTKTFFTDIKKCIGITKTELAVKALHLLENNC